MKISAMIIVCIAASPLLAADRIGGAVAPGETFVVTPPASGIMEAVLVQKGDRVQKGQILARLESTPGELGLVQAQAKYQVAAARLKLLRSGTSQEERATMEAELRASQAQLDLAEQSYARAKKLQQASAVSEGELNELEKDLTIAKTQVAQWQAKLSGIERGPRPEELAIVEAELALAKSAVDAAAYDVARCSLRSPADGTVLQSNLQVGGYARPGASSIVVADLARLVVAAAIPEARLDDLQIGAVCRVQTATGELNGTVRSISPTAANGRVPFVIQLEAADVKLLPGMKANVLLAAPQRE